MIYTKEQLQGMSDLEVNRALAMLMHKYAGIVGDWMPNGVKVNDESNIFYSERDYCNNPSDIMPLAFEYKIRISPYMDIWCADFIATGQSYFDSNPMRAITCCLILVLQEKE